MVAVRNVVEIEESSELWCSPLLDVNALAERLEERLAPAWEKREILFALGALGGPTAAQVLRRYLCEPDPGLEQAAQEALEQALHEGSSDRNSPCGCGSGAKWKHCCARERIDWSETRRTHRAEISGRRRSR